VTTHTSGMSWPRPDWVMCGMPQPGGETGRVRLLASKELNHAELTAQMEYPETFGIFPAPSIVTQRYTLTAEARTFIVIDAPDYPAAFKALFEDWTPEPATRPALGEGQRAITA
jgi:hypothetical protein